MTDEHRLQTPWTYWYDFAAKKGSLQDDWKESLKEITTVHSAEELLYTIESIEEPSSWPVSSNLHFFRNDILPAWEDKFNIAGGKWVLEIVRGMDRPIVQNIWKKTLLFCVSEIIPQERICGVVFSPRKNCDRFSIWTHGISEDEVMDIGKMWKDIIELDFDFILTFRSHRDVMEGGAFWTHSLYTIKKGE